MPQCYYDLNFISLLNDRVLFVMCYKHRLTQIVVHPPQQFSTPGAINVQRELTHIVMMASKNKKYLAYVGAPISYAASFHHTKC